MATEKHKPLAAELPKENKMQLNKAIIYVFAILLFVIITYLYFSPIISGNSVINQGDITQFKGMSKELVDYKEKAGELSLWTNSMFGGMPSFTVYTLYPGNILGIFNSILTLGLPHPSGLLFLSMLNFFILMLALRMNVWVAISMAIASGLSSYNLTILEAGHNSKMTAIAYMPLVIAGVLMAFRNKYILGGIITAIGLSLEIKANHVQITYYLMLMLIVFGIVELISSIRKKTLPDFFKASAVLIVAGIFGIITNAGFLMS
ncbi:MAG: hypothetical protein H7Y00_15765, partial [Fimbriimonadaceae bacterium]|nr:hypothetical protein [Chitinophagales bacterium]